LDIEVPSARRHARLGIVCPTTPDQIIPMFIAPLR
jgi:hypothetical protein